MYAIGTLIQTFELADKAVTYPKIQDVATDRLLGRDAPGSGQVEEIAAGGGLEFTGSQSIQRSAINGDVAVPAGSGTATIQGNAVDNTKLADMAQALVKGRAAGAGTGDPQDLTAAQLKTILAYLASEIAYSNGTSGLTADDVQEAIDELDSRLDALSDGMVFQGPVDAGGGAGPVNFPGAGAAQAGWFYTVINAAAGGTQFGSSNPITVHTGDALITRTDNASATDGADWFKVDTTDAVTSVAGKVGTVVLETGDITNVTEERFLGRAVGAGTGVAQQLTAAQAKAILGQFVTTDIADDAITFAKMQNIATDRLIGRDTAATGDPEEIAVGGGLEFTGSQSIQRSALTGDVTAPAGSGTTTIPNDTVDNARLANMAQALIKGRAAAAGTGDPQDLTAAQVKAILALLLADITTNAQYSFGLFTMGFSRKDNTSSSGSVTIDLGTSNKQRLTLSEDVTALTFTAPTNPCSIILQVIQDSTGGWTIDWADVTNLKWPGGTEAQPTADPDAVDIFSIYWDGTNYHIAPVPNFLVP